MIGDKNLTVSGKINGTDEIITNADRQALLEWGKQFFINYIINTDSGVAYQRGLKGITKARGLSTKVKEYEERQRERKKGNNK